MDIFHRLFTRRQADERLANLRLLGANSPTDKRTELILVDDEEAGVLGRVVTRHMYLQDISVTFLAVTDPTKETAGLIEYVRRHRPLTKLSLVTAWLLRDNGTSYIEERELIVDAFLKAAIDNPNVTDVSLNCCRYKASRLAQLMCKPGLKNVDLANCRSMDDLSQPIHQAALFRAMEASLSLATFRTRRSFESPSIEGDIIARMSRHPVLSDLGVSIRNVATAAIFRTLIASYHRPMKFALLGSVLDVDSVALIIEGFQTRESEFRLDLIGCKWDNELTREAFLLQLSQCPKLAGLSIDPHCGLSRFRIWLLEEAISVRYRLTNLA